VPFSSETEEIEMARPRAFDENTVLDAAMDCFWRDGYEATSIRELAAEMGINAPSLYNAFGDKRSLFREVLRRYVECSTRARIALSRPACRRNRRFRPF
jgi:TetR/AcrR family transcriptional regulator, transcriptional repressor for nem operon